MRIVLDYRPALRARTGVGEFAHELARALAQNADEVVLFTSSWKDRPAEVARRELARARFVDRRIPVRVLTWSWNRAGWPPIETLAGPCDVVQSLTPLLVPARRAAQVVMVHDLDFLQHAERTEGEMRRDFPELAAQHVPRADHVITPSAYTAREVERRLGVEPNRITVCSPGPPAWAADVAARRARGLEASYILFLGTLEPRKNVGTLIAAYQSLVDAAPDAPSLVLAGRISEQGAHWQRQAAEAGLGNRVRFTGYVDDADRPELFAGARMLVLPSYEEGFGFPVLEAMSCGVPVVISDRGALPEVAGDAALPVAPDDVEGLAERMRALLDPAIAGEAVSRGLARAARYSWTACAQAARRAYDAAVQARRQR